MTFALNLAMFVLGYTATVNEWQCPVCGLTYGAAKYENAPKAIFLGGQEIALGGDGLIHLGGCAALFNKDPAKYLADDPVPLKPSRAGESLVCPVSGETFVAPSDEEAHVVQFKNGQSIYLCCPGCVGKLKANITNYITSYPKANANANEMR